MKMDHDDDGDGGGDGGGDGERVVWSLAGKMTADLQLQWLFVTDPGVYAPMGSRPFRVEDNW